MHGLIPWDVSQKDLFKVIILKKYLIEIKINMFPFSVLYCTVYIIHRGPIMRKFSAVINTEYKFISLSS